MPRNARLTSARRSARITRVAFGLALALVSGAALATESMIENIRLSTDNGRSRMVLDLSQPANYHIFTLTNPNRIVLDVKNARLSGTPDALNFSGTPVRKMRFGKQADSLRMVLEVSRSPQASGFLLPAGNGVGPRLVIDLYEDNSGVAPTVVEAVPPSATSAATAARPAAEPAPLVDLSEPDAPAPLAPAKPIGTPKPAPAAAPSVVAPAPLAEIPPPRAAEPQLALVPTPVMSTPPPAPLKPVITADSAQGRSRDVVIAIDPGHGGKDPGAIGHYGTQEKDVVLSIAQRLGTLLDQQPGVKAVLTRSGDQFVPLRERMTMARQYKADLFISIHADSSEDSRAHGSSVYMLSPHGATSEAARWLADRENSADLIGGVRLDDKDPLLASVLLDLSQSATSEASLNLASSVLNSLHQAGRIRSRKVEKAGFVVLKSPDIPSILVETAYVSNVDEEHLLSDQSAQQTIANALLQGVHNYLREHAPPGSTVAELNRQRHPSIGEGGPEAYQVNSAEPSRDARTAN